MSRGLFSFGETDREKSGFFSKFFEDIACETEMGIV